MLSPSHRQSLFTPHLGLCRIGCSGKDCSPAVGNVVDLLGSGGRNDNDAVLVTDNGIAGADSDAAAADDTLRLPRLHGGGALLGSGREREGGDAVADHGVCGEERFRE
jgi:hypothetical protein